MSATRIVYGACCAWWDSIDKVEKTPEQEIKITRNDRTEVKYNFSIPCCPLCGGVLFEVENETKWFKSVDEFEAAGHAGYRKFIEWLRGKCFKNIIIALAAYRAEGHGEVNINVPTR